MINAARYQRYASSPEAYRNELIVDVDGVARRFGDVQDPWQRADFAGMDAGLLRCVGRSDDAAKMRVYLERGRGSSKTTDLAVTCSYALAFAARPLRGYVFAADKDQAGLLKDAMHTLVRLNPWLGNLLDVQKSLIRNIGKGHPGMGSTLETFTSDIGSSYGLLADFLVCDELTHWPAGATTENEGGLWHSIVSSAAKRRNCLLCVIANAGFIDSWQWLVREAARTDTDRWHFSRLDGPVASWITPERLEEQARMLPAIAYARLWGNEWSSGGGDALLPKDIDAAFLPEMQPMTGAEPGWVFAAGVDLGLTRDATAVVVLAVSNDGRAGKIRLAHHKLWKPARGQKVNLLDVERHILELDSAFGLEYVAFDPWQMEHLAQTLEADTVHRRRNHRRLHYLQSWCREMPSTPTNLRQQATLTIESFNDRRLQLFPCEPLRRDLHRLRVVEKNNSFRMESPRDGEGHGDNYSAFALALVLAHELAGQDKRPLGGMLDGNGETTDARLARLWQQRQEEFQREHEFFNRPDTQLQQMRDSSTFQILGHVNPK